MNKIIQTLLIMLAISFVVLLVMSPIIVIYHLSGVTGLLIWTFLCLFISIYSALNKKGA